MAESQAPADYNVGWQELSSETGQKYRVKASDYDIADKPVDSEDEPAASGPPFNGVKVNWEVGTEGVPSEDVQNRTGITWYKLEKNGFWAFHKYKLTITTKDTYNYNFFDQEPDFYKLDVWRISGTHSFEYDSKRPTIVSISGV